MNLLDNHLEQISLSAATIAALPYTFPPPKAFTEALVNSHDITALIRDTEAHERILFTATSDQGTSTIDSGSFRRSTLHANRNKGDLLSETSNFIRPPRKNTAVATLLGVELGERLRKEGTQDSKERGEVDVELLLKGAEKLCSIYPIRDVKDRIASLRSRYNQLNSSVTRYEAKVSRQTAQLAKMNRSKGYPNDRENESDDETNATVTMTDEIPITVEDVQKEEEEIQELEKKRRALEDRVSGMEKDLGGLLR